MLGQCKLKLQELDLKAKNTSPPMALRSSGSNAGFWKQGVILGNYLDYPPQLRRF